MTDHGGCRLGNVDRHPVAGPCRVDCLHRALVGEYRATKAAADEARKLERELSTNGYATEGAEWDADHPALTFRDFLVSRRADRERAEVLQS